jgi:hypothetical protein
MTVRVTTQGCAAVIYERFEKTDRNDKSSGALRTRPSALFAVDGG